MEPRSYQLAQAAGLRKSLDANLALDLSRLYQDLPLPADSQCIRVIHIPHEKDPGAALIGSLQIVSLQDSPLFTALSYVWGTYSAVKDTIECDGVNIPITTNCRDAIVSLRTRSPEGLAIWIDAICINQNDEIEKVSQIKLIGQVYAWASEVYVWLGNGDQRKYQAMKYLRRASNRRGDLAGIPWRDKGSSFTSRIFHNPRRRKRFSHWSWVMLTHLRPRSRGLKGLFDSSSLEQLMQSEWIDRAWTLQEAVLASNPTIVCGTEIISWKNLIQAVDHLHLYGSKPEPLLGTPRILERIRSTFIGPTKAQSPLVSDAAVIIPSFEKWRALSNMWVHSQRPTHWNNKQFRSLSAQTGVHSAGQMCSVWQYYQEDKGEKTIVTACVVLIVTFTGFVLYLLFSLLLIVVASQAFGSGGEIQLPFGAPELVLASCNLVVVVVVFPHTLFLIDIIIREIWISDAYSADGALNGVLRSLRERQATIPEDKAFALSSVLYSLDIAHTEANYDLSLGEVYHRLFLDLLRYQPAVINLLVDVKQTYFPGLPSWVPDWSTVQQRHWLKPELIYGHVERYRDLLPSPQMTINERKLGLWSTLEGTVAIRTEALSDEERDSQEERRCQIEMLKILWRFLAQAQDLLPEGDAPVCSATEIARVVTECVPDLDEQHTTALTDCLKARNLSMGQQDLAGEPSLSETLQDLETNRPENLNLALACCDRLMKSDSCLFLTTRGCLGFGPIHAEKGDTIALLRGVAVPMVLRTAEEEQGGSHHTFSVIGPAYVGKHMDLSEFNAGVHGVGWVAVYLV